MTPDKIMKAWIARWGPLTAEQQARFRGGTGRETDELQQFSTKIVQRSDR
ncbi:MAG: hypothetical protein R2695_16680 [Acidimicrobiales bacterium]